MDNQKENLNNLLITGNAKEDGDQNNESGWFIGHFINSVYGLRCTQDVEVKWGVHLSNDEKSSFGLNEKATTLALLISGAFIIDFPDLNISVNLDQPGDYLIYAPGISHSWKALKDSILVTIRWPSILGDQKQVSKS